jgi:hypothetical protein
MEADRGAVGAERRQGGIRREQFDVVPMQPKGTDDAAAERAEGG